MDEEALPKTIVVVVSTLPPPPDKRLMSTPVLRPNHHKSGYLLSWNSSRSILRLTIMTVGLISLLWLTTTLLSLAGLTRADDGSDGGGPPPKDLLSREELENLVNHLRREDMRVMRWHARSFTRKAQKDGGCESMPAAMDLLVATASGSATTADDDMTVRQHLALEYVTFCVTDNPAQRSAFSERADIHKAVVKLLSSSPSPAVSSSAAHVIYIATFSNKDNHYGFFRAGAVAALTDIVLRYPPIPPSLGDTKKKSGSKTTTTPPTVRADQAMWSLAALQNLAASYCRTKDDGRCYWRWGHVEGSPYHTLNIDPDGLPVTSEATAMRVTALKEERLVPHLVHLACTLGVHGEMSPENPFPGDNAVIGRDEDSPNLVSWAAAGALKNLALDPSGRDQMSVHEAFLLPCLCRMSKRSPDWLERNKAEGLLRHLRYGDPCWWSNDEDENDRVLECVDHNFSDADNYNCADYVHPSDEECRATDVTNASYAAAQACCGCGGGMIVVDKSAKQDKEL